MRIEDVIMDMGAKIRDTQVLSGGSMLNTVSRSNYKYKTDVPEFVDSIALPRIHQAMEECQWRYDTVFYIGGQKYELHKWCADDGVEIEVDDRILKVNKKHFRKLYENRDK